MPKRKHHKDDPEYIYKKIKKLQKKLHKSRNKYREQEDDISRSSPSPFRSDLQDEQIIEPEVWLDEIDAEAGSSAMVDINKATQPEVVVARLTPTINLEHVTEVPPVEAEINETAEPELDSITLEILGADPSVEIKYGKIIQKDVALRLEHIAVSGLPKELRKELTTKYLTPANCTLIDPPTLNAEIKAASSEIVVKRDKAIEFKQKQLAAAISCIGDATTRLLASKEKDAELLKMLMDANRILCDCQYADSKTRKSFMLSTLKPDMKNQLQDTKLDKFLFGENLQEAIKSAKIINKSGTELKANNNTTRMPQSQNRRSTITTQGKHLNWKGPLPGRRQPGVPRTREPAPRMNVATRPPPPPPPRPQTSYRPSQRRPETYHR